MSEELLEFDNTVEDEDGRSHVATVLGAGRDDGTWIGWVRFRAPDGQILETGRETTQPNRDNLMYWATGLTYSYLEGALVRAKQPQEAGAEGGGEPGDPAASGTGAATTRVGGVPSRSSLRLDVLSLTDRPVHELMGATAPRPGTARELPDAGAIVYKGATPEGDAMRYSFALQFGSENAGAILANWLWSRLHDSGAEVRVNGVAVEVRNDTLKRAIVGR